MRDEQGRAADIGQVLAEPRADVEPRAGVERGQRLVEQQRHRVRRQRASEGDALGLAPGQRPRLAVGELAEAEPRRATPPPAAGTRPWTRPMQRSAERDVVDDREVGEQPVVLEHQADPALCGGHEHIGCRVVDHATTDRQPALRSWE